MCRCFGYASNEWAPSRRCSGHETLRSTQRPFRPASDMEEEEEEDEEVAPEVVLLSFLAGGARAGA